MKSIQDYIVEVSGNQYGAYQVYYARKVFTWYGTPQGIRALFTGCLVLK